MTYDRLNTEVDNTMAPFLEKIREIKATALTLEGAREVMKKSDEMHEWRTSYWTNSYLPMQGKIEKAFASKEVTEEEAGNLTKKLMGSTEIYEQLFEEVGNKLTAIYDKRRLQLKQEMEQNQEFLSTSRLRLHQPKPNPNPNVSAEVSSCSLM